MDIAIIGGGAAGFFAAITCAEANPACRVTIFERGQSVLEKVRVSGGGRCNVTHACFDARELVKNYPRGSRELLGPFLQCGPEQTVEWFARRGVTLKTEADGRAVLDQQRLPLGAAQGPRDLGGVTHRELVVADDHLEPRGASLAGPGRPGREVHAVGETRPGAVSDVMSRIDEDAHFMVGIGMEKKAE